MRKKVDLSLQNQPKYHLPYFNKYTTGPIFWSDEAVGLTWTVLNNDRTPQDVRVTVYKCNAVGWPVFPMNVGKKVIEPNITNLPPIDVTIPPDTAWCEDIEFITKKGRFLAPFEVQVETMSELVFPSVTALHIVPRNQPEGGEFGYIPWAGTQILAAQFIKKMP